MKTHRTIGPLQIIIIVLTLAIALIHMSLLFPDALFLLNGIGYLVLLALLYFPARVLARFRRYTRWMLIAYTAATIVFWIVWGVRLTLGYIAVAAEAMLILLLAYEGYQAHWANRRQTRPDGISDASINFDADGDGQLGVDA